MSSKIDGVPAELLRRAYWELDAGTPSIATLAELKAVLAAPVVERQPNPPVCVIEQGPFDDVGRPQWVRANTVGDFDLENIPDGTLLWMAPPELAELQAELADTNVRLSNSIEQVDELQATIARLTAENERLKSEPVDGLRSALAECITQRDALKGGQGEPVAFEDWFRKEIGDPNAREFKGLESRDVYVARKAWNASQPAPVSVPDRCVIPPKTNHLQDDDMFDFEKGWNACIDRYEEINQ